MTEGERTHVAEEVNEARSDCSADIPDIRDRAYPIYPVLWGRQLRNAYSAALS